jgi:hypothetical protein
MLPQGYADAAQHRPLGLLNPANWFAKKQPPPTGPRPSPLQVSICRSTHIRQRY